MAGSVKCSPTAPRPVCEYAPLQGPVALSGAEPRPPAAGQQGQNTGPLSSGGGPEAGRVTCWFYWTKSGNYLITSNYAACGAGLARRGWSAPLWATSGSRGARWESLAPHFFPKSLRNNLTCRGGSGASVERPSPHRPANRPANRGVPLLGR